MESFQIYGVLVHEWGEELGEGWVDVDWFGVRRYAEAAVGRADGLCHGSHEGWDGAVAWIQKAQAAVAVGQLEDHHGVVRDVVHVLVEKSGEEGLGLGVHRARERAVPVLPGGGVEIERHVVHDVGAEEARQFLGGAPVTLTMPGYLTCSYALKEEIVPLTLPPNARVWTCDCKAMYPSIPLEALDEIEDHLHSNNSEFEYDADALIDGLKLLMENMLFQFGDLYYKQISGTAMGVPPARDYADIFFGIHELSFLPEFKEHLQAYRRFVDDILWNLDSSSRPSYRQ